MQAKDEESVFTATKHFALRCFSSKSLVKPEMNHLGNKPQHWTDITECIGTDYNRFN